ncbi:MAG TPA: FAD-dependent oxidoreductase [Reyranella sp.]
MLGGGIAGCAAALALGQRGIDDVLIVEAGTYDCFHIGETIPPDTRLLLERLRLWDGFADQGHEPCLGSRSAWGADDVGYNDFLLNPHGVGWHLDRRKFGAFLAERAGQSGAEVRSGTRFVAAERGADDTLAVLLQMGEELERIPAKFVVDATGLHSRFAKAMGATPLLHDRLLWIGGVLDRPADLAPSQLTMIEAVEYGWWYAARVPDGRTIVGAITDAETNRRIALHRPGRWLLHLEKTRHMTAWLADCRFGNDRLTIRPAPSFVLDRICGSDWLAVGDAAAAYDPIASQGIHKALSDGLLSAAAIADHLAGIHSAFDGYAASITAGFADYLSNRNYLYGSERRWPSSTFWQNRARTPDRTSLWPAES